MTHYFDIALLLDPEFPSHQLLSALYAKLHRALVQLANSRVAVSFPDYSVAPPRLGSRIRLIGSKSDLDLLTVQDWTGGVRDHVRFGTVDVVPAGAVPRTLVRVQAKSSPQRLRRRQIRRHGLSENEALERLPDTVAEKLRLPFVQLVSSSTGQPFRVYLRLGEPQTSARSGAFNSFGLSGTATIPWF